MAFKRPTHLPVDYFSDLNQEEAGGSDTPKAMIRRTAMMSQYESFFSSKQVNTETMQWRSDAIRCQNAEKRGR
jgi:hypothetical protein